MKLHSAVQNEAIVSNVGEIGEFRIRNSAKAFNILSSGLYANKIRAIVRELSCNAIDSHTAAGKTDTPFDVHLPNALEPFFSIRDYGTGLSHAQVTNIYTTYFESTKADSNAFIGALGLGSKSPFSYTDNFTVTAVKDGRKGIYTAFINEQGVPSIALMMEEQTTDPAGVEVRFAVSDRHDFDKFRQEARIVYKHFSLRPVITGNSDFTFINAEYESRDIVPGVHSYKNGQVSVAIMGNIAYPIDIPRADTSLGDLRNLLNCNLELHFAIGELDFQASREGLSYIPSTIEAIKNKLEAVNQALTVVLAREANAIANLWDRAIFIHNKRENRLWAAAAKEYLGKADLPTFDLTNRYGPRVRTFNFKVEDLAKNWNIQIKALHQGRGSRTIQNGKVAIEYADNKDANGHYITWRAWNIPVDKDSHFLINDTLIGGGGRVGYHYREVGCDVYHRNLWILEKADRTKDMDLKAFFTAIHNPPEDRVKPISSLKQKTRESVTKNVSILKLERRGGGGYRRSDDDFVWRDAGDTSAFPDKAVDGSAITYYYVPLSGFFMESKTGYGSGKELYEDVKSLKGLFSGEIYGVRKKDIDDIKTRKNWKNFEDHITERLSKMDTTKILLSLVRGRLDSSDILSYNNTSICMYLENKNSPYYKFVDQFRTIDKAEGNTYRLESLFRHFAPSKSLDPTALIDKCQKELYSVIRRYPLLNKLNTYRCDPNDIAEYINMCDVKKGIE